MPRGYIGWHERRRPCCQTHRPDAVLSRKIALAPHWAAARPATVPPRRVVLLHAAALLVHLLPEAGRLRAAEPRAPGIRRLSAAALRLREAGRARPPAPPAGGCHVADRMAGRLTLMLL